MLLTEINETFKGIKSLLAKLFMTTDSAERGINHIKHALFAQVRHQEAVNRELVEIRERLKTLEQRQNFIYVTAPLPSPLPTTDAPPLPWSDRVTCATNSPLGPFRERTPKTALTKAQQLEDDFNARANPSGTAGVGNYVPAPRAERVPRYDYGNEL
jgi:hypothetical protein